MAGCANTRVSADAITREVWREWLGCAPSGSELSVLAGVAQMTCSAHDLLILSTMSKTRRSGITDRSATTDIVTQLECAVRNPQAALIGALIGGLVPWFGRTLAHEEIPSAWSFSPWLAFAMVVVVIGCAVFSGLSVYKFGKAAFGDSRKALGFVFALEGVMLVSRGATSTVALIVLILINAVANGTVIALARDASRRRCQADARRAATRVANRSHGARVSPATAAPPIVWRRPAFDDVMDAEIVSEETALS